MGTVFSVICVSIILLIILTRKTEINIVSRKRLTVTVNFTLLALEFSNFKKNNKKRKRKPNLQAIFSAAKFLKKRASLTVNDVSLNQKAPPAARGAFEAFLSIIFAYYDSTSGRITLPNSTGICDHPFTFSVTVKARLYVFISAFAVMKLKNKKRKKAWSSYVRE